MSVFIYICFDLPGGVLKQMLLVRPGDRGFWVLGCLKVHV